jgi:hypothetical protein
MAIHQERYQQHVRNPKAAVLLALLLGPIGMFYATMTWAVIMLFMNIVFGVVTYGLAILILWPLGARIAYKAVCTHNQKLLRQRDDHMEQFSLSVEKDPGKIIKRPPVIVSVDDPTRTIFLKPQGAKIYRHGKAVIKVGLDLIRTGGGKCFSNDWIRSWSKTEFSKTVSSFGASNRSPLSGPTLKPNEEAFGTFELRLISLKNLRDKGLVNEMEFNNKKKAILDEL